MTNLLHLIFDLLMGNLITPAFLALPKVQSSHILNVLALLKFIAYPGALIIASNGCPNSTCNSLLPFSFESSLIQYSHLQHELFCRNHHEQNQLQQTIYLWLYFFNLVQSDHHWYQILYCSYITAHLCSL